MEPLCICRLFEYPLDSAWSPPLSLTAAEVGVGDFPPTCAAGRTDGRPDGLRSRAPQKPFVPEKCTDKEKGEICQSDRSADGEREGGRRIQEEVDRLQALIRHRGQ